MRFASILDKKELDHLWLTLPKLIQNIQTRYNKSKACTVLVRMNKETNDVVIGRSNTSRSSIVPEYNDMKDWLSDQNVLPILLKIKQKIFDENPKKRSVIFYYNDKRKQMECDRCMRYEFSNNNN